MVIVASWMPPNSPRKRPFSAVDRDLTSASSLKTTKRSKSPAAKRRTNSLGWAVSDCHTCQVNGRTCDRRRPRCDTCMGNGVLCGGFVQQLNWQPGVASRGKLSGQTLSASIQQHVDGVKSERFQPTSFIFIPEDPWKSLGLKNSNASQGTGLDWNSMTVQKPMLKRDRPMDLNNLQMCVPTGGYPALFRSISSVSHLPAHITDVLHFYQWTFSLAPLTYSVRVNPWQICLPMALNAPCLMDAVLAVGKRNRAQCSNQQENLEVLKLKERSLSALSASLEIASPEIIIGTILTLIVLDVSYALLSILSLSYIIWLIFISILRAPIIDGISIYQGPIELSKPLEVSKLQNTILRCEARSLC